MGDPMKLAELVIRVADMEQLPFQLIAGPDALTAIGSRMDEIRGAMEQHAELSQGTNFNA